LPDGGRPCPNFKKIIDFVENFDSAKKKLLDAVKSQQAEVEVGIYKKTFGARVRYLVIKGEKDSVAPVIKDRSWKGVGHYHRDAHIKRAFRYPAPQDFQNRNLALGERLVEIIFSHDAAGQLIEIEYGLDLSGSDPMYFLKGPDGKTTWFEEIYPNEIQDKLANINNNPTLTTEEKLAKTVAELKKFDSETYYAAWWASLF